MSYQYSVNERRRRRQTRGTSPSFGQIRTGSSHHHSTFGYWVPLVLTVGAAADYPPPPPGQQNYPPGPGPEGAAGPGGYPGAPPLQGGFQGPPAQGGFRGVEGVNDHEDEDHGLVARVSNAFGVGRSASPAQKTLGWAGKKVSAGVAAAGAMAGAAMKSMGMSGEDDAERWSEEADNRHSDQEPKMGIRRQGTADEFYSGAVDVPRGVSVKSRKRTTVAVVVSAVDKGNGSEELDHHTSILAHLPEHINPDTTRVLVLIYAPDLKVHPLKVAATQKASSQSMASSFSNISRHDAETPAQTPGEYAEEGILTEVAPNPIDQSSSLFKTLYNQAEAVVETDTMVLPYTTKNGHKHILKSLGPEIVYIQESLCGEQGEVVSELSGWVRQIVVVIGDEGGTGGLVDTDDEESREKLADKWWTQEARTGLGKRVTVVEGARVADDWNRRLNDKD
ncbi:hypothetical protein DV736_g4267, partial [Chaetothyriales sp. CBS 134916]